MNEKTLPASRHRRKPAIPISPCPECQKESALLEQGITPPNQDRWDRNGRRFAISIDEVDGRRFLECQRHCRILAEREVVQTRRWRRGERAEAIRDVFRRFRGRAGSAEIEIAVVLEGIFPLDVRADTLRRAVNRALAAEDRTGLPFAFRIPNRGARS